MELNLDNTGTVQEHDIHGTMIDHFRWLYLPDEQEFLLVTEKAPRTDFFFNEPLKVELRSDVRSSRQVEEIMELSVWVEGVTLMNGQQQVEFPSGLSTFTFRRFK